jgi:hypothetical protein
MADAALRSIYAALLQANRGEQASLIAQEQNLWLVLRDRECRVNLRQALGTSWTEELPSDDTAKAVCVLTLTRLRESELRLSGGSSLTRLMAARVQPRRTYEITSLESRRNGKWYFEVFVDATQLAFAMDALIFVGFQSGSGDVGRLIKVRPDGGTVGSLILLPAKKLVGLAIDLDAGQVYIRENGKWITGAPETKVGIAVPKNGPIKAMISSSVAINTAIDQNLVRLNFGTAPFTDGLPTGFSPYRTGPPSRDPGVNSPEAGTYVVQ